MCSVLLWFHFRRCLYTKVLNLFCSSSYIIINFGLLEMLCSTPQSRRRGTGPMRLMLPPVLSLCQSLCSRSGTEKDLRIHLLGWKEKSGNAAVQNSVPIVVCVHTSFSFPLVGYGFFVHLYHDSMKTTGNWEIHKSLKQAKFLTAVSTSWSVYGHLCLSRWPKGVSIERTHFCRGVECCSNVVYTKQLKILKK